MTPILVLAARRWRLLSRRSAREAANEGVSPMSSLASSRSTARCALAHLPSRRLFAAMSQALPTRATMSMTPPRNVRPPEAEVNACSRSWRARCVASAQAFT